MDISPLRTFIDAAHWLSFAAVAEQTGSDPSSISRTIKALEDQLGTRLFHRTTRRMSLTEEGSAFLLRAKRIVAEWEASKDDLSQSKATVSGTLRITASIAFGECILLPTLQQFRQTYPAVGLDLLFTDANLDLAAEAIDLAIRFGPEPTGSGISQKLFDTCYRVCATPNYLAASGIPEQPADLADRQCLLFTLPAFRTEWTFRNEDQTVEIVPVKGDIAVSSALSLRSAALASLGPALLPNWLIGNQLADGSLVDLFPAHQVTATSFTTAAWLIYPSRDYVPQKTRVMIDFLKEAIQTN